MIKKFDDVKESIVQEYVVTLVSSLKTCVSWLSTDQQEIDASLLLQIITHKYIDKFQSLITHSSSGEKLSINEQVEKHIIYASNVDTNFLFSDPKVSKKVY
jgi:hypothetical protein